MRHGMTYAELANDVRRDQPDEAERADRQRPGRRKQRREHQGRQLAQTQAQPQCRGGSRP